MTTTTISSLGLAGGVFLISGWVFPSTAAASLFGTDGTTCGFTDLQAAVDAAGAGGTVYVRDDGVIQGPGATVDFDLTLQGSDASCSAAGTGTGTLFGDNDRLLEIGNGASVIVNRMNLEFGESAGPGGIVFVKDGSTLIMLGGRLHAGVSESDGGCLFAGASSVSLWDVVVEGCHAQGNGGAISLLGADLFMDSGTIARDSTSDARGGIFSVEASSLVSHGEISGGHADDWGGGIYADLVGGTSPSVVLHGALLDNDADVVAGGIYVGGNDATLTLEGDALVSGNDAASGGGIYGGNGASVTLRENVEVSDNHATTGHAGGIFVDGSDLLLEGDVVVQLNTAGTFGGGVVADLSAVTITGSGRRTLRISDNTASGNGGGLYLYQSTLEASDLLVDGNTASGSLGGGVIADFLSNAALANTIIEGNSASSAGGLLAYNSDVTLESDFEECTPSGLGFGETCSEVRDNQADASGTSLGRGGGLVAASGGSISAAGLLLTGNAAADAGNDVLVRDDGSSVALINALVVPSVSTTGVAIDVREGSLDLRSSIVADQDVGVHVHAGGSAVMHRNIVAFNSVGAVLDGVATGNCNLSQAITEAPTGTNNDVGDPVFWTGTRSDYQHDPTSTLTLDVCSAGPANDIDGKPRPSSGSYDRGAYERPIPVILF